MEGRQASQIVSIPGTLAGYAEWDAACAHGAQCGGRLLRDNVEECAICIREARLEPVRGPVELRFTWVEPTMRRRKDDVAFGKRFVIAALVECGVLPDSRCGCVVCTSDRFMFDPSDPMVTVEVVPVGGEAARDA